MKNVHVKSDFIVIGSGIAGLYTALKLKEIGEVVVLTKDRLQESNTQYAQGGIAAALDEDDSWQLHAQDTLRAGAGLCDPKMVNILTREGKKRVEELIELGMNFDVDDYGKIDFTREGAHSKRRILHAGGDATGRELRKALTALIANDGRVEVKEKRFVIDLVFNEDDIISGVLTWNRESQMYETYSANAVILASGGCGRIYKNTTNPSVTTGDGVAMAYRAGAEIVDMEFIQFHPTALYNPGGLSFLISESVRGEGAVLLNTQGERFMPSYHELAELAPRDIVTRAITSEISRGDKPYVWLDATHLDGDYIVKRFPTIYQTLKEYGIDMRKDKIAVAPAAHYMMGGVKIDSHGRTNLDGLYACGEVACSGVHGANRLASNSLLEGLVFAHRIYEEVKKVKPRRSSLVLPTFPAYDPTFEFEDISRKLPEHMMKQAGIKREGRKLSDLEKWLKESSKRLSSSKHVNEKIWQLKNMLTTAMLIVRASLIRSESRGAHFRADHPQSDPLWSKIHVVQKENGGNDVLE